MMDGIDLKDISDDYLVDRYDYLDALINIDGWDWNPSILSAFEVEKSLVWKEFMTRTDPKKHEVEK